MEQPRIVDRTCETCEKNIVCEAYAAMKNCKETFEQSFEYVRWPINSEILALHCNQYLQIKSVNEKSKKQKQQSDHCTV